MDKFRAELKALWTAHGVFVATALIFVVLTAISWTIYSLTKIEFFEILSVCLFAQVIVAGIRHWLDLRKVRENADKAEFTRIQNGDV